MQRDFTRGQTQVLYRYLPGAVFDHEDYGAALVTEVQLDPNVEINQQALFDTLLDVISQWPAEFASDFPDPAILNQRRRYVVGRPSVVRFRPFPEQFQCKHCERVYRVSDLQHLRATPGVCPRCRGNLTRLKLVQIHNCGRLDPLFIPRNNRGPTQPSFHDPGRVTRARWYDRDSGQEIQRMRMNPCGCAFNRASIPLSEYDKRLRVVPTGEPSLFFPQVAAFVNFPQDSQDILSRAHQANALLLARVWGILGEPLEQLLSRTRKGPERDEQMAKVVEQLRKHDPNNSLVQEYDRQSSQNGPQASVDAVIRLTGEPDLADRVPPRRLVEYVALLDKTRQTTLEDVIRHTRDSGQTARAERFGLLSREVLDDLGLASVRVINDFPIALAAFGYTRVSRNPAQSILRPFEAQNGRLPLYVLETETEGLWFQLDPARVANWLVSNRLAVGDPPKTAPEAWAWLQAYALGENFHRRNTPLSPVAEAVQTLLHTMSHVLLSRIEWSGFKSSSIGEYLMPETLSFILYTNRYAESKIGGLTSLFEQRLPYWLRDAALTGRDCLYDPLCHGDGGSCAGCLHREHGCELFNRRVSRAVLYGGPMPEEAQIPFVATGYWSTL